MVAGLGWPASAQWVDASVACCQPVVASECCESYLVPATAVTSAACEYEYVLQPVWTQPAPAVSPYAGTPSAAGPYAGTAAPPAANWYGPATPGGTHPAIPPSYYLGRGWLGQPTLYAEGQPVRNALRYLTP